MSRRLTLVAGICTLLISAVPTFAEYPTRPITLIVPAAAGGFNDVIARVVAEHMARTLGQPIIIENDPGAGGTTATRRASQASADGYTILVGSMGTHAAAPAQYPALKYNPAKDFTPVGLTAEAPAVIVTRRDFPASDLKEFVDFVRKHQDKLTKPMRAWARKCTRTARSCRGSLVPRHRASLIGVRHPLLTT